MDKLKENFKKLSKLFYVRWIALLIFAMGFGFLVVGPLIHQIDNNKAIETASSKNKKLPIYCVGTDEKKVAISFDAAWGATI